MGSLFGAPKATPAPLPSKTADPVDAEALARARKRAEDEKARAGRSQMKIGLQSNVAPATGSGVVIP